MSALSAIRSDAENRLRVVTGGRELHALRDLVRCAESLEAWGGAFGDPIPPAIARAQAAVIAAALALVDDVEAGR